MLPKSIFYFSFPVYFISEKIWLTLSSLPKDLVQGSISVLLVSITYQMYVSNQFHLFFCKQTRAKIRVVDFCLCPIHFYHKKQNRFLFFKKNYNNKISIVIWIGNIKTELIIIYLYYLFNYIIKNLSSVIYIEVKGQNYYHEILQSLILEA